MLITPIAVIAPGRPDRDGIEYENDAIGAAGERAGGICETGGTGGHDDGAATGAIAAQGSTRQTAKTPSQTPTPSEDPAGPAWQTAVGRWWRQRLGHVTTPCSSS